MKKILFTVTLLGCILCASINSMAYLYQIDDGNAEYAYGGLAAGSTFTWANVFKVESGYNLITGIYIAFGLDGYTDKVEGSN